MHMFIHVYVSCMFDKSDALNQLFEAKMIQYKFQAKYLENLTPMHDLSAFLCGKKKIFFQDFRDSVLFPII